MNSLIRIGGKKIKVTHPEGVSLKVEGNTLVSEVSEPSRSVEYQLKAEMSKEGIQLGDAIAWATDLVGVAPCPRCKAWRRILNNAKKLGVSETVRQMWDWKHGSR